MGSIEKEKESREIEAEVCAMVRENRFLLGMKPAVKAVLRRVANHNDWQLLKMELER